MSDGSELAARASHLELASNLAGCFWLRDFLDARTLTHVLTWTASHCAFGSYPFAESNQVQPRRRPSILCIEG